MGKFSPMRRKKNNQNIYYIFNIPLNFLMAFFYNHLFTHIYMSPSVPNEYKWSTPCCTVLSIPISTHNLWRFV